MQISSDKKNRVSTVFQPIFLFSLYSKVQETLCLMISNFLRHNLAFYKMKTCLETKYKILDFFLARFFFLQNNKNNVLSINRLVFQQKTTFQQLFWVQYRSKYRLRLISLFIKHDSSEDLGLRFLMSNSRLFFLIRTHELMGLKGVFNVSK